jgi:glucose-1-phosphate cytidylyltransferase
MHKNKTNPNYEVIRYFIFTNEIFNYINDGEELVEEPFRRLIAEDRLHAFQYNGFWASMDTFKDKPSNTGI